MGEVQEVLERSKRGLGESSKVMAKGIVQIRLKGPLSTKKSMWPMQKNRRMLIKMKVILAAKRLTKVSKLFYFF